MNLVAHLEEFNKNDFKEVRHGQQGANSIVTKLEKKKGIPEVKFKKSVLLEDQLHDLINEIHARTVINHVNAAFKAFGYKTNMMDIPIEFDWHIDHNERYGWQINMILSAFKHGKAAVEQPIKIGKGTVDRGEKMWNIMSAKANYLNALIGNNDFHQGNIILHDKAHKNYAIDFGLAFNNKFVEVNSEKEGPGREKEWDKKRYRWERYLVFWDFYIKHNQQLVKESIKKETAKTFAKLNKELYENAFAGQEIREYMNRARSISEENIKLLSKNFSALKAEITKQLAYARGKK
jgi:hypothetical protein